MLEYKGYTARIVIDGEMLLLTRKGMAAKLSGHAKQTRKIPLAALSAVGFIPATRMANGVLQLGLGGEPLRRLPVKEAVGDPDAVLFTWQQRNAFTELRDYLLQTIEHHKAEGVDPSQIEYEEGQAGGTATVTAKLEAFQEHATAKAATVMGVSDPTGVEDPATLKHLQKMAVALRQLKAGVQITNRNTFAIDDQSEVPVAGVTVTLDQGAAAQRVTATRAIALGIVPALLWKKDTTKLYLTFEGTNGSACVATIAAKQEHAARRFALLANGGPNR